MPTFGMNMLLWTDDIGPKHFKHFEQLKRIGYDAAEIPLLGTPSPKRITDIGRALKVNGLLCSTVTIGTANANPIDDRSSVRRAWHDHMKRCIAASAAMGSKRLCGPFEAPLGVFPMAPPSATQQLALYQRAATEIRLVAEFAQQNGDVVILPEFLNRFELYLCTSAKELDRLVGMVNHPNCQAMYDTFHDNIEGDRNVYRTLKPRARRIRHVHISESHRGIPGTGRVDFHWTFKALIDGGYQGWYVVEAFGQKLARLAAATKIWRRTFGSEIDLCKKALRLMRQMTRESRSH